MSLDNEEGDEFHEVEDEHRIHGIEETDEALATISSIRKNMLELMTKITSSRTLDSMDASTLFDLYYHSGIADHIVSLDPTCLDVQIPPHCVPICADVRSFDWETFAECAQFDCIVMDPPWHVLTSRLRGVNLNYSMLADEEIARIPIPRLQRDGLLFLWVVNSKHEVAMDLMRSWGYEILEHIVWIKQTCLGNIAKGHGNLLQHSKEICLLGSKGDFQTPSNIQIPTVIYGERRANSQKPDTLYNLIEDLFPRGRYLEIFGRVNNLRNYWITIGNEV